MAKTARAAIEDLLTCESCHAFYYVERGEDGARTRLRCTSCGHSRDVLLSGAKTGKWTLIDPDGEVKTFGAWEDLLRESATSGSGITAVRAKVPSDGPAPASVVDDGERKSLSGSALLDITPTPIAKLSLVDSSPALPAVTDEVPERKEPSSVDVKISEPKVPLAAISDHAVAAVEALVDSMPEATPAAPRITKEEKPEAWDDDEAEVLSMRDIQVVTDPRHSSTPPPPPAGQLRTLPPARLDAPPPPSIRIEEPTPIVPEAKADEKKSEEKKSEEKKDEEKKPEAKQAEAKKAEPKQDEKKKDEKKAKDASAAEKKPAKDKENVKEKEKDDSRTRPTTRPPANKESPAVARAKPAPEEEGGRGWVLPAIGVAAAAAVVWWMASAPSAPASTTGGTSPTTAQTTTATAEPTAEPTATAEPVKTAEPVATAATASPPPADKAATTAVKVDEAPKTAATAAASAEPKKNRAQDAVSLADALDKAGTAKRSGDYAAAKELYGRVLREAPNNVEAHGGLGDIARAQGDLATAKASYQKALAASPDYGPAVLGLADTLWDMGDRAGAQSYYASIVRVRGANAPERAKTRSTSAGD